MEDGRWKLTDAGPGADPAVVVVEIGEQFVALVDTAGENEADVREEEEEGEDESEVDGTHGKIVSRC